MQLGTDDVDDWHGPPHVLPDALTNNVLVLPQVKRSANDNASQLTNWDDAILFLPIIRVCLSLFYSVWSSR